MHVLNLVANSALPQFYKENLSYSFARGHCCNGVNKTKGIEQSTVQRHGKEVGLERRGVGVVWGL